MSPRQAEDRRYLVPIDTASTQQLFTDCLVIGAGVAGLRAAIEAAPNCDVTVVCKGSLSDSNTWHAQGGIASVLGSGDSFKLHIADTIRTGCGLCDDTAVGLVVRSGPELILQLVEWGAEFDKVDGRIDITLEGGHSRARVAHAYGDSTGRGIAEALIRKVRDTPNINLIEHF
ncbi:MAG: FAD-dependent oxidoreductase, partial [Dehalococcoidales bacterium]